MTTGRIELADNDQYVERGEIVILIDVKPIGDRSINFCGTRF